MAPAWPLSVTRTKVVRFARASTAGFLRPLPWSVPLFFYSRHTKRAVTNCHVFIKFKYTKNYMAYILLVFIIKQNGFNL